MTKDTSWHRFFNPKKSPSTSWKKNKDEKWEVVYWPKNLKPLQRIGRVVWPSSQWGTYEFAKYGELK